MKKIYTESGDLAIVLRSYSDGSCEEDYEDESDSDDDIPVEEWWGEEELVIAATPIVETITLAPMDMETIVGRSSNNSLKIELDWSSMMGFGHTKGQLDHKPLSLWISQLEKIYIKYGDLSLEFPCETEDDGDEISWELEVLRVVGNELHLGFNMVREDDDYCEGGGSS